MEIEYRTIGGYHNMRARPRQGKVRELSAENLVR